MRLLQGLLRVDLEMRLMMLIHRVQIQRGHLKEKEWTIENMQLYFCIELKYRHMKKENNYKNDFFFI